MLASSRTLVLATLLALLGVGFWWWRSEGRPVYFCEAAARPAAYEDEWFYRLHAGPDGWLLRDDDLNTAFRLEGRTLGYLERLNETLEAKGVTLILAAQPPRGAALTAESLPGYDPAAALRRYAEARATLEGSGLRVADLAAVVTDTPDYFFRRDHHWTPSGAEGSARAVAQTVASTAAYRELTPQTFRTEAVGREEQIGSFGEAIGRICGDTPPTERFARFQTEPETAPGGTLFGEAPPPPIALAGTSNSARDDLNFAGFLEQATGLAVLNTSTVGGGPEAALEAYLRSPTFHEATPSFLVWEFATLFDLPQDPRFYRQLLPSVQGACTEATSTAAVSVELKGPQVTLFETAPEDEASFLYLEFSDLSRTAFELGLSYRDGEHERVVIRRSSRERNDGRYFWELSGQPTQVTLALPEGAGGSVQAQLCP
jgi:alginate biosynthesis protein AlgX